MRVIHNEKLTEYLIQKEKSYEVYATLLNELNVKYDPIKSALKKQKKNQIYFLGWIISFIVFFTFLILFIEDIFPDNVVYIVYGILVVLLGVAIFLVQKNYRKIKMINREWLTQYNDINKYRIEGNKYLEQAADEVFKVISENNNINEINKKKNELSLSEFKKYRQNLLIQEKQKILKQIGEGATVEEIIEYYKNWGKALTDGEKNDHQSFLESRRKRHLKT